MGELYGESSQTLHQGTRGKVETGRLINSSGKGPYEKLPLNRSGNSCRCVSRESEGAMTPGRFSSQSGLHSKEAGNEEGLGYALGEREIEYDVQIAPSKQDCKFGRRGKRRWGSFHLKDKGRVGQGREKEN